MIRRPLPVALALALVAGASAACDATRVRCVGDRDCPTSLPACVEGVCAPGDDEDPRGEGEGEGAEGEGDGGEGETGEGEGEGDLPCDGDEDCGAGLCWTDASDPPFLGQCLPGPGIVEACGGSTAGRDVGGPVLAVGQIGRGGSCTPGPEAQYSITVYFRDAEGDVDTSSGAALLVTQPGGAFGEYTVQWGQASEVAGSGGSGHAVLHFCAFSSGSQLGIQLLDGGNHGSNVVCVPRP